MSNNKWNYTKKQFSNIIYNNINTILNNYDNKIELNLLVDLINNLKNINIKYNKKKLNINDYIINNYEKIEYLIDEYNDIGILYKNNKTFIIKINNDSEWIIV